MEQKTPEDIFNRALQIPSRESRQRFLAVSCAGDSGLRKRVDAMLRANELADGRNKRPAHHAEGEHESTDPAELEETLPPRQERFPHYAPSVDQLPRSFGDYELLEKIAHGGMGVVYKARQSSLNRIVAIKMILAGQIASADEVRRFYLEAEAAAKLDHPGIVPVFDVGCCCGQHFFSMGFVDGESLADVLKKGPLPPRVAASYVRKISLAVQAAHEMGVIHRDLKPGNVLMDADMEPRVTDFGLAKQVDAGSNLTATGMVIGTPSYMPPEQASGRLDQIDATADVYSLGAILYALLTGRPPFEADTQVETLMQVLEEEPVAPRRVVSLVPKDLEAVCLQCLEKTPAERYSSAKELAEDLDRFLAGEPIGARNDIRRRLRKWTLRQPVLAAHLGAIAVMMFFIFVNYLGASHPEESWRILLVNECILVGWAIAAIVLQSIHNYISSRHLVPVLWAAINPVLLTGALWANDAPRELLYSLYLLLIITTGFFRRVELVVATTASSLFGYFTLLMLVPPESARAYKVMFAVILVVTGVMIGFQVSRLKRISEKDAV